ncbi:MAG: hypothetical protein H0X41_09295, partial [Chitinophagaceae bacterium]|nr:hypothetical protein [Chitinophagaceae bacterium]
MKAIIVLLLFPACVFSQTLQLNYDLRKSVDPARNPENYPTLYFEYWKGTDSASVLVKIQADLTDKMKNIGKTYLQVAKTFRMYKRIQLHLSYGGGLGLTNPREYSYSITNTFQAGLSYPFEWNKAYLSTVLD